MYELAIRHSFGKPAIVIAEEETKLPFDVLVENTIFYRNDPTGANELKQQLIEYEKSINPEKKDYGPVYKVVDRQDKSREFSNRFRRGKILVTFKKDNSFTNNEVNEILNIFRIYDAKNLEYNNGYSNTENCLHVFCNISEKSLVELKAHL